MSALDHAVNQLFFVSITTNKGPHASLTHPAHPHLSRISPCTPLGRWSPHVPIPTGTPIYEGHSKELEGSSSENSHPIFVAVSLRLERAALLRRHHSILSSFLLENPRTGSTGHFIRESEVRIATTVNVDPRVQYIRVHNVD